MEIDINQQKISFGDKYKVFVNELEKYSASKSFVNWLSAISLWDKTSNTECLQIRKRWAWFKAKYDIIKPNGEVLEFRTKSFWKLHYHCHCARDYYEIFGHRGTKYSVYKNDSQIAWWNKDRVVWFAGDNYKIIADSDCDAELIMAFCLIIDNHSSDNHDGNAVTIDFGNIGPQAKKFVWDWQPKL